MSWIKKDFGDYVRLLMSAGFEQGQAIAIVTVIFEHGEETGSVANSTDITEISVDSKTISRRISK